MNGRGRSPVASCRECRELLVPYLDGELDGELAGMVASHVAGCRECGQLLEEHDLVARTIRSWSQEEATQLAPPAAATLRGLRRRLARARQQRALRVSAAAAVLAGAMLGYFLVPGPHPPEADALILEHLDVLETIQEEAGELSPEMVNALLEVATSPESLDEGIFDYVLEEELAGEKI
jgi:anti-sigma factor RsiW